MPLTLKDRPTVQAGFAISAKHVLTQTNSDADEITITTSDNTAHQAKVVVRDNVTGLCVAEVDDVDLVSLVVGNTGSEPGLPVVTTWIQDGVRRCKQGMISSPLNSSNANIGMTQHVDFGGDTAVTGSPIVDVDGILVGVTMVGDDGSIVCLPATQLTRLIDSALGENPADLQRGLVGASFMSESDAVVAAVRDNSPASAAGLLKGDRVSRIGDHSIRSSQDVVAAVAMWRAGDSVEVAVQRGDETLTMSVTLEAHPQQRITMQALENQAKGDADREASVAAQLFANNVGC